MVKFMVPVVRDVIAEREGIESMVGEQVEIIKKISKNQPIQVSGPRSTPKTWRVYRDVYLVKASKSRFMSPAGRCENVLVNFKGYKGNDVYSAEELGL